jgi:hypothetical protein
MTAPGLGMSDEIALTYIGVVPSLAHIHESVATGAREAAKIYSTAFQAESIKTMTTASAAISQALSTALKPKMAAAGLEAGKSYGTGLGAGIKASQAEVAGSLAGMNSAFREHRQAIADTTTKVEDFGLSTVAMSEKVTGTVHPLGTASTGIKGLGSASKEAGEHLKGLGTSVRDVGQEMASVVASPLGLTAALGGAAAASGLLTDKLLKLGDVWEQVDRIMAVSSDAAGDRLQILDNTVKDVATHSSASIESIATIVAKLNGLTKGLSGGQLDTLTTQLADLSVMLGAPVDVQGLVGAAHALGIADDQISEFADHLFAVSRTTGAGMGELIEATTKYGYVLKGLNIPMDEGVSLLAQMETHGIPAAAVIRAFTAASKTAAKEGVPFNQFMSDAIQHMEKMKAAGDSADKIQAYATTKFGPKGGLAISDAFQQGILTSQSLTQAQNIQSASIEETFEKTRNLGDEFKILANTASVALAPIGKAITHGIGGSLEHVSDWIRTHGDVITKWMKNIVDGALSAGEAVLRAFQPMLEIIGKLEVAFGNLTGDDAIRQSGVDLENFGKGLTLPGGPIDSLHKMRGEADDFFDKIKQTVGISELLGDALKTAPDGKGLIANPKLDPKQYQEDIDRLKQYGVTVLTGPDNKMTITTDTKENKDRVDQFIKQEGGKEITVTVVPVPGRPDVDNPPPHAPGTPGGPVSPPGAPRPDTGPSHDGRQRHPQGIGGWLDEILVQDPADAGEWIRKHAQDWWNDPNPHQGFAGSAAGGYLPGGFGGGGFTGYLPGDSNTDNLMGFIPGKGAFGLAGGEAVIKTSAAKAPWVKAMVHGLNHGYAGGTDNVFGIPIPSTDPNAPGAPPGGWSSKTTQHDQAWQDAQTAAARSVERANDRIEDLQSSVDTYSDTLKTLTAKMQEDDPDELIADQKEYAKTLRESNRAERDLLEAKQDLTSEQRKQTEARDKPPESAGKGGSGEDLGKGIVKGIFQELGLPSVFGDAFTSWGVFKTAMAALQDFLPLAMRHRGAGTGTGMTVTLPTDQQRGGIVIGPGGTAQYGVPGPPVHGPLPGPAPAVVVPAPAGQAPAGPGGGGGPGPAAPPGIFLGPGGADGGGASTYGPGPGGAGGIGPGNGGAAGAGYQVPQGVGGDGSKVQLASAIYTTLTGAGYTPQTAVAAIAAGQFESGLDPNSMNPSQHHGVWQESSEKPSSGFGQQLQWLLSEMAAQGGPAAFAGDPVNAFADKVERGGYSGAAKYNLGAAMALLGGAGAGGGGFNVPTAQSAGFTMPGGGLGGPAATDTATSGLARYGGIPGAPSGIGQPIVGWMEQQVADYNARTGSNLSITADYPGGPHGHPDDGGDHSARRAIDVGGSQEQMTAFANWWASNPALSAATRQLIHQGPGFADSSNIIGGHPTSGQGTYGAGTMAGHGDHVHVALEDIPGQFAQMVPPLPAYGGSTPPGQSGSGQRPQQAQLAGYSTSDLPGDLGLPTDGYTYKHGDTGIFGLAGSLFEAYGGPTAQRVMHPLRSGAGGNVATPPALPPPDASPAPPSAITAQLMSRTAPDLDHVGGTKRGGANVTHNHYSFSGITDEKKIQPRLTSAQIDASRATIPRML